MILFSGAGRSQVKLSQFDLIVAAYQSGPRFTRRSAVDERECRHGQCRALVGMEVDRRALHAHDKDIYAVNHSTARNGIIEGETIISRCRMICLYGYCRGARPDVSTDPKKTLAIRVCVRCLLPWPFCRQLHRTNYPHGRWVPVLEAISNISGSVPWPDHIMH